MLYYWIAEDELYTIHQAFLAVRRDLHFHRSILKNGGFTVASELAEIVEALDACSCDILLPAHVHYFPSHCWLGNQSNE